MMYFIKPKINLHKSTCLFFYKKVIAHEVGHNLGLEHDDPSCGKGIMNSLVYNELTTWTRCSRNYLQEHYKKVLLSGEPWCLGPAGNYHKDETLDAIQNNQSAYNEALILGSKSKVPIQNSHLW